jgi:hypothetical protein
MISAANIPPKSGSTQITVERKLPGASDATHDPYILGLGFVD